MASSMSKYVAELMGTFTLVFVGTAVAVLAGGGLVTDGVDSAGNPAPIALGSAWILIAFAFGFTLLALAFTLGGVSGCHINPAVTIAMAVAKKIAWKDAVAYVIVQVIGATVASVVLFSIVSGDPTYSVTKNGLGANGDARGIGLGSMFLLEVVLTALFLMVIFSCTDGRNLPPGLAPIPIGVFLFVAHLIGVPLGDSSLNPARSTGPAVISNMMGGGSGATDVLWLFWIAPIVGGLIGYFIYSAIWPPERKAAPAKAARKARDERDDSDE